MFVIQDPEIKKILGLLRRKRDFVFFDTSRPDDENIESLLFLNPLEKLICRREDDPAQFLDDMQIRLQQGYYLAGWLGYEFGVLCGADNRLINNSGGAAEPLAELGVFSAPLRFNHRTAEHDFPLTESSPFSDCTYLLTDIRPNMDRDEFIQALHAVQQYIRAGDTYQVNYTMKLFFDFEGSAERLYYDLRRNQSVAYGAYIRYGEERILSFSPELFFRKRGGEIIVRPMKGTAERGRYHEEELRNMELLHRDPKNRSENVMIVDLLRNDLAHLLSDARGRGGVVVESLFDVESYESLLQMTSTVKATGSQLAEGLIELRSLFQALFPCGSITGAPKIRTMEIIGELEKETRGVYTGAIGFLAPDGSAVFNVPIRTLRLFDKTGEMGIGAGITHDSKPLEEWKESLLKGRFLTHRQADFYLFETILWRPEDGYWLLDDHLQRLERAAQYFKFSFNESSLRRCLSTREKKFKESCYRVRLTLEKDGRTDSVAIKCERPHLDSLPLRPEKVDDSILPRIDFSRKKTVVDNAWYFHKTSRRDLYNFEYETAHQRGLVDILFCNDDGEVTEGCISNIIIFSKGKYYTPPVRCGLLPGVMRGQLLGSSSVKVTERVLLKEDVGNAEAVYICNSVRGVVRVALFG